MQYKSMIFYHTEEQKNIAIRQKNALKDKRKIKLETEIRPIYNFYLAETYHQKYFLQLTKVFVLEFEKMYPNSLDFINSTAAARINGYCKGFGNIKNLQEEINTFGLSEKGRKTLVEVVSSFGKILF